MPPENLLVVCTLRQATWTQTSEALEEWYKRCTSKKRVTSKAAALQVLWLDLYQSARNVLTHTLWSTLSCNIQSHPWIYLLSNGDVRVKTLPANSISPSHQHTNFQVQLSGLHVDINDPYLGATPDCIVSCECCGVGLLEIKCPFKYKNSILSDIDDRQFYLEKDRTGELKLKSSHDYYAQVQAPAFHLWQTLLWFRVLDYNKHSYGVYSGQLRVDEVYLP